MLDRIFHTSIYHALTKGQYSLIAIPHMNMWCFRKLLLGPQFLGFGLGFSVRPQYSVLHISPWALSLQVGGVPYGRELVQADQGRSKSAGKLLASALREHYDLAEKGNFY